MFGINVMIISLIFVSNVYCQCKYEGLFKAPVDIRMDLTEFYNFGPLSFTNFDTPIPLSWQMYSKQNVFVARGFIGVEVSGGPLKEPYVLMATYLTWPSRHLFEGLHTALEIHMKWTRKNYSHPIDDRTRISINVLGSINLEEEEILTTSLVQGEILRLLTLSKLSHFFPFRKDHYIVYVGTTEEDCRVDQLQIVLYQHLSITAEFLRLLPGYSRGDLLPVYPLNGRALYVYYNAAFSGQTVALSCRVVLIVFNLNAFFN